jgi:V/A-type H+-transporting ATPase subunit C
MTKSSIKDFSVVHARVRAMYSKMLTPQVWQTLCEASDFSALINILHDTIYRPSLSKVDEKSLTPRRTIYQIEGNLADITLTTFRLVPSYARPLLSQLHSLYEVDNLKAVMRGVETGASWSQVQYVLFPSGPLSHLVPQALLEAGNIAALVELLQGTTYYGTLSHAMKRYTAEKRLFPLEVALDLEYWRQLWNEVQQLPTRDRTHALRIIGSMMDINNLIWAIRYRLYHHSSEEEIINYTLPFGWRVHDMDIKAIAAGAELAHVVSHIYPDIPEITTLLQDQQEKVPEVEVHLKRYLAKQCRAAFSGYPFHIGIPLAYLVLNRLELQDLTVLIEAKSMELPVEEFRPYMTLGCTTV